MKRINKGLLVWITGLPGTGKTTLAKKIYQLIGNQLPAVCIDGDVIREIMGNDLKYNTKDRLLNAYRIARLNKYLVEHKLVVLCSTASLFKEIHQWNRKNIDNLIEVLIEVPKKDLHKSKRHPKNLYELAKNKEIKNVYGIDQKFDYPVKPDMKILNGKNLEQFLRNAQFIKKMIIKKLS